MAVSKIQYVNKEQMTSIPTVPAKNKCTADDLNEIKTVVNNNADILDDAAYGTLLYQDVGTGTNTDITLSENSSNFSYFDIYYRNNDNVYGIARVPYTTNDTFIATFAATGSDIVVKTATISFSGTTLQRSYTREKGLNSTNPTSDRNYIYIMKVVGHK